MDYKQFVHGLMKPGEKILETLTPEKAEILHMGIGVAGEAGELLGAVKNYTIYNKPLDRVNIVEELGDLEFFMEGLRYKLNITREETLESNVAKLSVRYKNKVYTDQEAILRADKMEEKFVNQ